MASPDPPNPPFSIFSRKRRHADAILKLASTIIVTCCARIQHATTTPLNNSTLTERTTATVMSSQIDPRLQYAPATLSYQLQRGPLPRIDQVHGLPAILDLNSARHQQTYLQLPPTPSLQGVPTPQGQTPAAPAAPPPHPSPFSHAKELHVQQPNSDSQVYVASSLRRLRVLQ